MEEVKFAPHETVEEWLQTKEVSKWKEQWVRDGYVVVEGLLDEANCAVYRDLCEKLLRQQTSSRVSDSFSSCSVPCHPDHPVLVCFRYTQICSRIVRASEVYLHACERGVI